MRKNIVIVLVMIMLLGISGCSKPKVEYLLPTENGTKVMVSLEKDANWTIEKDDEAPAVLKKEGKEILRIGYAEDLTEIVNIISVGDEHVQSLGNSKKDGNNIYFIRDTEGSQTGFGFVMVFKGGCDGIIGYNRGITEEMMRLCCDMLSFRKVS